MYLEPAPSFHLYFLFISTPPVSENLEPVCCSTSSSNCCFLTCIQISQEAGQVVWYSHLFQNLPQFIVIHTVKGFGIVNKAEIDDFLKLSSFFMIQRMTECGPLEKGMANNFIILALRTP